MTYNSKSIFDTYFRPEYYLVFGEKMRNILSHSFAKIEFSGKYSPWTHDRDIILEGQNKQWPGSCLPQTIFHSIYSFDSISGQIINTSFFIWNVGTPTWKHWHSSKYCWSQGCPHLQMFVHSFWIISALPPKIVAKLINPSYFLSVTEKTNFSFPMIITDQFLDWIWLKDIQESILAKFCLIIYFSLRDKPKNVSALLNEKF